MSISTIEDKLDTLKIDLSNYLLKNMADKKELSTKLDKVIECLNTKADKKEITDLELRVRKNETFKSQCKAALYTLSLAWTVLLGWIGIRNH